MNCNNTGNFRSQKPVLCQYVFLCCLFAVVIFTPIKNGHASDNDQSANGVNVMGGQNLPAVLYSLQISTYMFESAAQRAYDSLLGDLQGDGFVYKTDSGYYTLRFGQAASRDDLQSIETQLAEKGYSYTEVRTDPGKLNIAKADIPQTSEQALESQSGAASVAEADDVYVADAEMEKSLPATPPGSVEISSVRQNLPAVLHSLQINTYLYESAAQRAYEALPVDLQADGFVYKTDSGYYTLRFGQAASRNDLQLIREHLTAKGYSYTEVRTDPGKLNIAKGDIPQTSEQAMESQDEAEIVAEADDVYVADAETEKALPAAKQHEASGAGISEQNRVKTIPSTLYEDDIFDSVDIGFLATNGNHLRLSLEDTMRMAIDRNSDIKIGSFLLPIADEEKKSIQAVYDPTFIAENTISRTDRPIQSLLEVGTVEPDIFLEDKWDMRAGIEQPLRSGGTFSFSLIDVDRLDSSSDLVVPNPQYTSRLTLELRQALLKEFGDKTNRSALEIADLNLDISGMEFRKIMAKVIQEVGTYYWRLVYYAKQISISSKYLQDAEDIYQKLLYREESGLADLLDVDRAIASVNDRKAIFIKANTEYKLALDQLKFLLNFAPGSDSADVAIIPTEKLMSEAVILDKSSLQKEAVLNRPEYIIAQNRLSAFEIQKKLAKHLKLPTLDARAMYAFNALGEEFDDAFGDTYLSDNGSWAVGLEFVWPIGGRKADADYLKVVYKEKQSQEELVKTSKELESQINSAVTEIEQTLKEIEAVENSKEANQRLLSREESRFEIRQVNIQTLLDAQDDYYFAYRTYLRAISNYNISLLKLKWAKGTILEDYGVMLQN